MNRVLREFDQHHDATKDLKENRLQVILATDICKAVIGKGGENIAPLKQETGCLIVIEQKKVDLGE